MFCKRIVHKWNGVKYLSVSLCVRNFRSSTCTLYTFEVNRLHIAPSICTNFIDISQNLFSLTPKYVLVFSWFILSHRHKIISLLIKIKPTRVNTTLHLTIHNHFFPWIFIWNELSLSSMYTWQRRLDTFLSNIKHQILRQHSVSSTEV